MTTPRSTAKENEKSKQEEEVKEFHFLVIIQVFLKERRGCTNQGNIVGA